MSIFKKQHAGRFFFLLIITLLPIVANCNALKNDTSRTNQDKIIIDVDYLQAAPGDSLILMLENNFYYASENHNLGLYVAKGVNRRFKFVVPVKQACGYLSISKSRTFTYKGKQTNKRITNSFFWEKGDSVSMNISNKESYAGIYSTCSFSGRGSEKYTTRYKIDSTISDLIAILKPSLYAENGDKAEGHDQASEGLKILQPYASNLSSLSYHVLKADVVFNNNASSFNALKMQYDSIKAMPDLRNKFIEGYKSAYFTSEVASDTPFLAQSKNYLEYEYNKCKAYVYFNNEEFNPDSLYKIIKDKNTGIVRDKLISMFFIRSRKSAHQDILYEDAKTFMKDSISLVVLNDLIQNAAGMKMIDFDLPTYAGKRIKLSDLKGKVVLMDFWFNGCGGCALFYQKTLSKIEKLYKNNSKVAFVSVCADIDKKYLYNGIKSGLYTSKEALNVYTEGKGYRHPVFLKYKMTSLPFVVLLDKNGIIKLLNAETLYQYDSLLAAIKSLE